MKRVFQSYSGNTWGYDIHTGVVAPFDMPISPRSVEEEPFFSLQPYPDEAWAQAVARGIGILILNVTEKCSNRCRYCVYGGAYGHERTHSQRVMSLEIARKGVDFYCSHRNKADGKLLLSFYGGEPMFEEGLTRIRDVLAYAKARWPDVPVMPSFTTNGNHLTKENCRFLIENDVQVMVSLDGPKDLHDRYRRTLHGEPTFQTIMANLQRLHDLSPDYYRRRVGFIAVVTPPVAYQRRSAFFREHPLTAGQPVLVSNVSLYNQTLFDTQTIRDFAQETIAAMNEAAQAYYQAALRGEQGAYRFEQSLFGHTLWRLEHLSLEGQSERTLGFGGCCVPGVTKLFVHTDGTLYACEKMEGYYPLGHVSTGLDKKAVLDLIHVFERLRVGRCENCPYVRLCSLCYVNAMDKAHTVSATCLDDACIERCSFFKVALRLYASLREAGISPIEAFAPAEQGIFDP